jgi:uncharacterized protein (DUF3084 family)
MTVVREAWTDERLDDLNQRVSEGFADIRAELRAEIGSVRGEIATVRGEIGSVRGEIGTVRGEIGSVRGEIGTVRSEIAELRSEMNERIDSLQRVMLYGFVSLATMMFTGFVGIVALT